MNIGGYEIKKVTRDGTQYAEVDTHLSLSVLANEITVDETLLVLWSNLTDAKVEAEVPWAEFDLDGYMADAVEVEVEMVEITQLGREG